LKKYTGIHEFEIELLVDETNPNTRMLTTVTAYCDSMDIDSLQLPLANMLKKI